MSTPMSLFPNTLPTVIIETILTHLATLFLTGANGDPAAARHAAAQALAAYNPTNVDELRLAANIVTFSFQALEALAQAAAPDAPITHVLRLRSGAVSLSRQAANAERRLAQLRDPNHQPVHTQYTESRPEPAQPEPHDTTNPIEPAAAKANPLTWTQAHEQRQRDLRIAASLKRAEAKLATHPHVATQAASSLTG